MPLSVFNELVKQYTPSLNFKKIMENDVPNYVLYRTIISSFSETMNCTVCTVYCTHVPRGFELIFTFTEPINVKLSQIF
jgi:hypothetical protein